MREEVPRCEDEQCRGLVKPGIVFFGEQLPRAFFENRDLPAEADLCIVLGTSLSVQPFAGLPGSVAEGVPRVLVNMEQVGGLGTRPDDVLVLGDCDSGVRKLAEGAGWGEELERAWAMTAPEKASWRRMEEERLRGRSEEERLEEEVQMMIREVEEAVERGKKQQELAEKTGLVDAKRVANRAVVAGEHIDLEKIMRPTTADDGGGLGHVFPWLARKSSL